MIGALKFVESRIHPRVKIYGLLLSSLILAGCAQITLFLAADQAEFWMPEKWLDNIGNNSSPIPGLIIYILSGIVLISGLKRIAFSNETISFSAQPFQRGIKHFSFFVTSFGISILTCFYTAYGSIHDNNGYGLTVLWILSLCLFILSVFITTETNSFNVKTLIDSLRNHKIELFTITLLLSTAFLLRYYDLELHPYSLVNDEGEMGKGGLCILSGVCNNLFSIGWASLPFFTYLPYALSISIFSNTGFALRIVSAVIGSLSVLFTYLLTRELFNKKTAIIAGILLSSFSLQLHFSRLAVINIIDSLSYPLLLWLTMKAARTGKTGYYLLTGIFYGLAMMTYPGSRLAPFVAVLLFLLISIKTPGFIHGQRRNLSILISASILTFAPMGAFFLRNLDEFSSRMKMEGIIQNGSLLLEAQNSGQSQLFILFVHFLKSSLIFITSFAPVQFFNT
ncbi:MAG: glycosyltransferase family 39 protein, partial [Chloroflexota bacterium]